MRVWAEAVDAGTARPLPSAGGPAPPGLVVRRAVARVRGARHRHAVRRGPVAGDRVSRSASCAPSRRRTSAVALTNTDRRPCRCHAGGVPTGRRTCRWP